MRVAIDLHNTFLEYQNEFIDIIKKYSYNDYFLMTGSTKNDVYNNINKESKFIFTKDKIFSITEFLFDNNIKQINGMFDNDFWWASKSIMCKKYNIDILIDDEDRFGDYFKNHYDVNYLNKFPLFVKFSGTNFSEIENIFNFPLDKNKKLDTF